MKRAQYIQRANDIFELLSKEKIISSGGADFSEKLNLARGLTAQLAHASGIIAPNLTACVATTLLKVGLCQELAQRFVLEYILQYQDTDIGLIFLVNIDDPSKSNHALVYIGSVTVPEQLMMGRGSGKLMIDPTKNNQSLSDFFEKNKANEGILADPLFHCAGISIEEIMAMIIYCGQYAIKHVCGVRPYNNIPHLIKNVWTIKNNAIHIAQTLGISEENWPHRAGTTKPAMDKMLKISEKGSSSVFKKGFLNSLMDKKRFGEVYKFIPEASEEDRKAIKECRPKR